MAHTIRNNPNRLWVGVSLAALQVAAFAGPAAAQATKEVQSSKEVAEVVVTVSRVEQNVRDVPAAVNVMSEQVIKDLGISNVNDVMNYTPGAFAQEGAPDQSSLAIRGISADIYGASGDAAVVSMMDNAVISRSWMRSGPVFDLSRIEVARGPQGTTFGRNATGGVIHFITRKPQLDDSGSVNVSVGNYDSIESTVVLNRKLSDTAAGRLSAYYTSRNGYFKDEVTGRGLDNTNAYAVRGQLLFSPTERLEVVFRGNYAKENIDVPQPTAMTNPLIPVLYPVGIRYQALSTNPRIIGANPDQYFDRTVWDVGVEARYEWGGLNLTSMTNYRDGRIDTHRDIWGTTTGVIRQESYEDAQVFQQELRLDNSGDDARLQWVGGLYYLHENTHRFEQKDIFTRTPFAHYADFLQHNKTDSLGAFFNGTFDLTESTVLAAGARYTFDKKNYKVPFHSCGIRPNPTGNPALSGGNPAPFCGSFIQGYPAVSFVSGAGKAEWDNISYRVSITQKFGDDVNVYASYATGYKGGGFGNEPSNSLQESFEAYDPETVATMEVGIKAALFSHRLRIDLAAYSSDYKKIQAETILPNTGSNVVFNVGGATIEGFEGQFDWRVTERFTIIGNGGYVDAVYDDPGLVAPGGTIISSGRFRDVPLWQAYISANYVQPLANGAELRYYVDWRQRADRASDIGPQGQPESVNPGDSVFGARLTLTNAARDLRLSLWGRNLTNEDDFRTVQFGTAVDRTFTTLGIPQGLRRAGPPRTFGVSVDYDF